jgi:hypothetical protein
LGRSLFRFTARGILLASAVFPYGGFGSLLVAGERSRDGPTFFANLAFSPERRSRRIHFPLAHVCKFSAIVSCWVLLASLCFGARKDGKDDTNLKSLYDRHQWFELRDSVSKGDASAFYQAAVAVRI